VIPELVSKSPLGDALSAVNGLVDKFIKPVTGGLDCPLFAKYDKTQFNQFPGYKYKPSA
jgi:hypothetical protein